jgi:hypothetical protein
MEVVAMNMIRITAAALLLAGCQYLPTANPEQTAEQRLVSVCKSIYSALDASLDHNIDLAAVEAIEDIESEADVICSENGWQSAGLSVNGALGLAEGYLVRSLAKQMENQ